MKKLAFLLLAAGAVLSACEKTLPEFDTPDIADTPAVSEGRIITVTAQETKTSISPAGNGYSFTWNGGDAIRLHEIVYENHGVSGATDLDWFYSDALADDASTASFTVNLNTTLSNPGGGKYRYIATYPSDIYFNPSWTDYPVLYADFPSSQSPSATSFDPRADLMVSSPKVLDARAESSTPLMLNFARIGAIVKLTLSGLTPGEKVETGYILFGDSYKVSARVDYDPELSLVSFSESEYGSAYTNVMDSNWNPVWSIDSKSVVGFDPIDLYVDSEGKADIWLRLPEGKVTDSFQVMVWTRESEYAQWHRGGKSVNLAALNKSLTFSNGRLTTFSVATEDIPVPYIKLSYTYTDENGDDQLVESESNDILVGWTTYSYLSPNGGTVVFDVETNADPGDIVIEDNCDWVDMTFDPVSMKLTLTCDVCTEYSNYAVSPRECSYGLSVGLSSDSSASVSVRVKQNKRYFSASGTRKCLFTWKGGSESGTINCNFEPEIVCPTAEADGVSWTALKSGNIFEVCFTVAPNLTDRMAVTEAVIRDPVNTSKAVTVNLMRYPMIPEGDYYILSRNENAYVSPAPWFAAGTLDTPEDLFATQVAFDEGNNLDFDHTDYLQKFTFEKIEGSTDYRIYTKIGSVKYYLYLGRSRTSSSLYASLNPSTPKSDENSIDLSRWDVVPGNGECAILNHAYANPDNHTGTYDLYFSLGSSSYIYLAGASWLQMTYNQGSYGTSYFCNTYSYGISSQNPTYLKLYNVDTATYYPSQQ